MNWDLLCDASSNIVGTGTDCPQQIVLQIVGFPQENNILSPCGDVILLYKITRATNGRHYEF